MIKVQTQLKQSLCRVTGNEISSYSGMLFVLPVHLFIDQVLTQIITETNPDHRNPSLCPIHQHVWRIENNNNNKTELMLCIGTDIKIQLSTY